MISGRTDAAYLRNEQYKNADNLNARIALHARFSVNRQGFSRWVFDQLQCPEPGRVLEIGCGPGTFWYANRNRIPRGWEMTLTDFSEGMLEEARQKLADVEGSFRYEVADAQALPFESDCFDTIIANHMLYHVPDRPRALSEIRRVLKPEGRLYAATNGRGHMQELDELIRRLELNDFETDTLPTDSSRSGLSGGSFSLENGGEQLSQWFSNVTCLLYENELQVTEVEPILAYIRSCRFRREQPHPAEDRMANLSRFIARELAEQGMIRITNAAGLFIAS